MKYFCLACYGQKLKFVVRKSRQRYKKNTVKESNKDEIRTIFLKKVFTKVLPRDDSQYLYCTLYYRFTLHFFFLKIQCDF